MRLVNELSETIDLESTLIRAEYLFRRFQRLIEAIDKKQNFPAPRVLPSLDQAAAQSSSSPRARQENGKAPAKPTKTISPELRKLLSRKVEILPKGGISRQATGSRSKPKS